MMKWLRGYREPDGLALLFRRGMQGGPDVVLQESDANVNLQTPTGPVALPPHVCVHVPAVIDCMPVFIPPQEAQR